MIRLRWTADVEVYGRLVLAGLVLGIWILLAEMGMS